MGPEFVVVLTTCADMEQARRIAEALVNEHLAACVNLLPAVESIYQWEGKVERANEVLLLIKSTRDRFGELRQRTVQLHSYDTPEIICLPIEDGLEKYLMWMLDSVRGH